MVGPVPLRFNSGPQAPMPRPTHVRPKPARVWTRYSRIGPAELSTEDAEALIARCNNKYRCALRYHLLEVRAPISNTEVAERYFSTQVGFHNIAGDRWRCNLNDFFAANQMGYRMEYEQFENGDIYFELWSVTELPPQSVRKRVLRKRHLPKKVNKP